MRTYSKPERPDPTVDGAPVRHGGRRRRRSRRRSFRRGAYLLVGCAGLAAATFFAVYDSSVRRPGDEDHAGDPPTLYLFWSLLAGLIGVLALTRMFMMKRNRELQTS